MEHTQIKLKAGEYWVGEDTQGRLFVRRIVAINWNRIVYDLYRLHNGTVEKNWQTDFRMWQLRADNTTFKLISEEQAKCLLVFWKHP